MVTVTEGTFHVNGADLYTKTWKPETTTRAKLVYLMGVADHVGLQAYDELFTALANGGIMTFAHDSRGWGRSARTPKDRGNVGSNEQVLQENAAFIRAQLISDEPVFVMGYSTGGNIVLTLMCLPEYSDLATEIRGWLLHSPHVGFAPGNGNDFKGSIVRLFAKVMPKLQVSNTIPLDKVTRDPIAISTQKKDPYWEPTVTLEFLDGLIGRAEALRRGEVTLNNGINSVWVGHGNGDVWISYKDSKAWYVRQTLEDGEFKTYEGWYHQLHADLPETREIFAKEINDWILARLI
ncbi:putative YJU3 Serine localizes to lipid particle protein [Pleurostoma richardsiae]|uniref:YJU3 Serine localizes to lipid particle protein n=1 Tax=Pleurostoma richardsiae TaxID=41990 RepID=A0AA38RH30_9PEZI|nr:putative YJU3 Serine localizes to lipid particle protein [Pleurostoma richardsiae]